MLSCQPCTGIRYTVHGRRRPAEREEIMRRSRRQNQLPVAYILVFIVAVVLSIAAVSVLPIPERYKSLTFWLLVPVLSFIGVMAVSAITKKRR